jgi:hypothetical protein
MDGLRLAGVQDPVRIGRAADNELCLGADRSVSHHHAVIAFDSASGTWRLEDLHSTNGTWVDGARVTAPIGLTPNAEFLAGNAVIRLDPDATEAGFAPSGAELRKETSRLIAILDEDSARGHAAGAALAVGERRGYLTERHLLLGLAAACPDLPAIARGQGPLTASFLRGPLLEDDLWTSDKQWIARHLHAVRWGEHAVFAEDLIATPRLVRILQDAERSANRDGDGVIRPVHVLAALVGTASARIREYLSRARVTADAVVGSLPGPARPAEGRGRASGARKGESDVTVQTPPAAEGASLLKTIVTGGKLDGAFPDPGSERGYALALREILAFAVTVERFVVAMTTGLTAEGEATKVLLLPGQQASMVQIARRTGDDNAGDARELRAYLRAVEGWLLGASTAYQEAPGAWFHDLWRRISPEAIEAAASEGGRRKIYRIEAVELWERYKALVKDLTPESAAAGIAQSARTIAESRAARGGKGTSPGRSRGRAAEEPRA